MNTDQPRDSGSGRFAPRIGSAPTEGLSPASSKEVEYELERCVTATDVAPFVSSPHWQVRAEAADSPYAGDEHFARLASDPDEMVRAAVASQPGAAVGRTLVNDPNPLVRFLACRRPDVGADIRRDCFKDPAVARIAATLGVES